MAFSADKAVEQLVSVYRQAYVEILERIARKTSIGKPVAYEKALLVDINRILARLDETAAAWAGQVIPKTYELATREAVGFWTNNGLTPPPLSAGFAKIHQQSVEVLVQNVYENLHDAHVTLGRRIRDDWRRVQLEAALEKQATGATVDEAKERLQARVADRGLGAFTDKAGKTWRLDAYAEMAVRSVTAEAANMGMINQLRGMGRDLVQMSSHNAPCPICAPLEGRVYSITGETKGYPKLERAHGSYANIHPNCKHTLLPYVAELDESPEQTRAFSNRPFDIDPRGAKEKTIYEREQAKNRRRREERKEKEADIVAPKLDYMKLEGVA